MKMLNILSAAVAMVCSSALYAAQTVVVTGTITTSGEQTVLLAGQPYSITFDWVGPGADVIPASDRGIYPDAGTSFVFKSGAYSITAPRVAYSLRDMPGVPDAFYIKTALWLSSRIPFVTLTGSTPLPDDRFPYYVGVELGSDSETTLLSDVLIDPIPDTARYAHKQVTLGFAKVVTPDAAFDVVTVVGTIESISIVPEPSASRLLVVGLVIVAGAIARRRGVLQMVLPEWLR